MCQEIILLHILLKLVESAKPAMESDYYILSKMAEPATRVKKSVNHTYIHNKVSMRARTHTHTHTQSVSQGNGTEERVWEKTKVF